MNKKLHAKLKKLAPSVRFATKREHDPYFKWDGDGPDPSKCGYKPYNVMVYVSVMHSGEVVECSSCLGGSYYRDNEEIDDIHGYLPQMLLETTEELLSRKEIRPRDSIYRELEQAKTFLRAEMKRLYDEQQAQR